MAGALKWWDGTQWVILGNGSGTSIPVQSNPPATPNDNDLWVDSDEPSLKLYDATTSSWVYVDGPQIPVTTITAVAETTTARTLQLTDAGKVVEATNNTTTTITVPPAADVAWPLGTIVNVYAAGTGGVVVTPGTGVTIRNNNIVSQYSEVSLRYRGANEWVQI